MTKLSGRMNERYYIIRTIGQGGLTTVYKAFDVQEKRQVAIKVLAPHLALDSTFKARFEREIKILGQFDHPNIVPILGAGEYQGAPFLVMPFFSEGTLADRMRSQPLSPQECGRLISEICSALAYEHLHGVFHRDIKPSNILIDQEGKAYLSDFDLVYLADSSQNLTGSAVIGTPAYMSPEQCKGGPIDARSDQYSLAVVLYQLTTGHLPFVAETPIAIAIQQINAPLPRPRELNPDLPESVEAILMKALSKDPDQRYPSIMAFNHAFQRALKIAKIAGRNRGSWTAAKYYEVTQGFGRIQSTARAWFSGEGPKRRYALLVGLLLFLLVPLMLFAVWGSNSSSFEQRMRSAVAALYAGYSLIEGNQQQSLFVETIVAGTVSALEMELERRAEGTPPQTFPTEKYLAGASKATAMGGLTLTLDATEVARSTPSKTPTPTKGASRTSNPQSSPANTPIPSTAISPIQTVAPAATPLVYRICDSKGKPITYDDMHQHRPYLRDNGIGLTIHAIRVGGEETRVVLKKVTVEQDLSNTQILSVNYLDWAHWGMDSKRLSVSGKGSEITLDTDLDFYACYAAGVCDHSLYGGDVYVNFAGALDGTYRLFIEVFLPAYGETCKLDTSVTATP